MDLYPKMNEDERRKLSAFVETEFGIKMPASKKLLLESRLSKRLKMLNMNSFAEYYKYLISPEGRQNELFGFIDAVSTNKTEFFREPKHWAYLMNMILPEMVKKREARLRIWSAACSTGEEPYSIAMAIEEYKAMKKLNYPDYSILATDVSVEVLQKAYRAVYRKSDIRTVPVMYKQKYLMRNIHNAELYRITPALRAKVKFRRLNFMDENYNIESNMDIIFCRNALIYFHKETQERIIKKLIRHLKPGGYFIIGHSESMIGFKVNLTNKIPTVYKKPHR